MSSLTYCRWVIPAKDQQREEEDMVNHSSRVLANLPYLAVVHKIYIYLFRGKTSNIVLKNYWISLRLLSFAVQEYIISLPFLPDLIDTIWNQNLFITVLAAWPGCLDNSHTRVTACLRTAESGAQRPVFSTLKHLHLFLTVIGKLEWFLTCTYCKAFILSDVRGFVHVVGLKNAL